MNAERYAEYLRSPHWIKVRDAALKRAGHRCQTCNSDQNLDVHHRTYENLGHEFPMDLTVLCRSCHERIHGEPFRRTPAVPARRKKRKPAISPKNYATQKQRDMIVQLGGKPPTILSQNQARSMAATLKRDQIQRERQAKKLWLLP
jgi:hypothetical protein